MDAQPVTPPPPEPALLSAWPRSAQLAAAFLTGVVATLLAVHGYGASRWATRPTASQRDAVPDNGEQDRIVWAVGHTGGISRPASRLGLPPEGETAARKVGAKVARLTEKINVNEATADELQQLPGIGPKLSQRIVDTRSKAPFKSVEELRRVPGIGPKTLDKLRPHVCVSSQEKQVAKAD